MTCVMNVLWICYEHFSNVFIHVFMNFFFFLKKKYRSHNNFTRPGCCQTYLWDRSGTTRERTFGWFVVCTFLYFFCTLYFFGSLYFWFCASLCLRFCFVLLVSGFALGTFVLILPCCTFLSFSIVLFLFFSF